MSNGAGNTWGPSAPASTAASTLVGVPPHLVVYNADAAAKLVQQARTRDGVDIRVAAATTAGSGRAVGKVSVVDPVPTKNIFTRFSDWMNDQATRFELIKPVTIPALLFGAVGIAVGIYWAATTWGSTIVSWSDMTLPGISISMLVVAGILLICQLSLGTHCCRSAPVDAESAASAA